MDSEQPLRFTVTTPVHAYINAAWNDSPSFVELLPREYVRKFARAHSALLETITAWKWRVLATEAFKLPADEAGSIDAISAAAAEKLTDLFITRRDSRWPAGLGAAFTRAWAEATPFMRRSCVSYLVRDEVMPAGLDPRHHGAHFYSWLATPRERHDVETLYAEWAFERKVADAFAAQWSTPEFAARRAKSLLMRAATALDFETAECMPPAPESNETPDYWISRVARMLVETPRCFAGVFRTLAAAGAVDPGSELVAAAEKIIAAVADSAGRTLNSDFTVADAYWLFFETLAAREEHRRSVRDRTINSYLTVKVDRRAEA
jgi:hypothetical protein